MRYKNKYMYRIWGKMAKMNVFNHIQDLDYEFRNVKELLAFYNLLKKWKPFMDEFMRLKLKKKVEFEFRAKNITQEEKERYLKEDIVYMVFWYNREKGNIRIRAINSSLLLNLVEQEFSLNIKLNTLMVFVKRTEPEDMSYYILFDLVKKYGLTVKLYRKEDNVDLYIVYPNF